MAAEAARKAIFEAVTDGDTGVVVRMLDQDPQLLSAICRGDTLLIRAAWMGHAGLVRALLERGADVHAQDDDGDTALHCAAMMGREEVVSLLLTNGADIRRRGDRGKTALIYAAQEGEVAVVRLLLRHLGGRGLDDRDEDGCAALWYASVCGHDEHAAIFRVLLLSGADYTIPDNDGLTPQQMIEECSCHECAGVIEVRNPSIVTSNRF
jgi:ankyrin repeat protein